MKGKSTITMTERVLRLVVHAIMLIIVMGIGEHVLQTSTEWAYRWQYWAASFGPALVYIIIMGLLGLL